MKQTGFFRSFWQAFYSPKLYAEAAREWAGIGLSYIAFLTIIFALGLGVFGHLEVQKFVRVEAPPFIRQIPEITITEGRIRTPETRPYHIQDLKTKKVVAIIDTTRTDPPSDLDGSYLYATRSKVAIRQHSGDIRLYDLAQRESKEKFEFVLNQDLIERWMKIGAAWLIPLVVLAIGGILFLFRLAQLLFFSLITLMIAKAQGVSLKYEAVLRITALAMLPALIVDLSLSPFSIKIPAGGWLFLGAVIGYVYFGVHSVKTLSGNSTPEIAVPGSS